VKKAIGEVREGSFGRFFEFVKGMASLAITGAAGAFAAAAVALKGAVEVQTHFKWDNNVLARQGEGMLAKPSDASRQQQQRAGGIKGVGVEKVRCRVSSCG